MSKPKRAHVWAVTSRDYGAIIRTGHNARLAVFATKREARAFIDQWIDRWRIVKLTEGADS